MMEACATCDMTGTGVLCFARDRNAPGLCDPMHREFVNKMSRGEEPPAGTGTPAPKARVQRPPCVHLGEPVLGPDGEPVMRDCPTCTGTVRLKVFGCDHPAHGETTMRQCRECPDYEAAAMVGGDSIINYWRGG